MPAPTAKNNSVEVNRRHVAAERQHRERQQDRHHERVGAVVTTVRADRNDILLISIFSPSATGWKKPYGPTRLDRSALDASESLASGTVAMANNSANTRMIEAAEAGPRQRLPGRREEPDQPVLFRDEELVSDSAIEF